MTFSDVVEAIKSLSSEEKLEIQHALIKMRSLFASDFRYRSPE
ncbi:hypothetical protein [Nostoc edaphicum]|nr:hypothetical protein [Nostoc edaphicum]